MKPRLQEIEHRGRADLLLDPKTKKVFVWSSNGNDAPGDDDEAAAVVASERSGVKSSGAAARKRAERNLVPKEVGRLTDEGELQITETDNPQTNRLAELFNSLYLHMKVCCLANDTPSLVSRAPRYVVYYSNFKCVAVVDLANVLCCAARRRRAID